MPEEPGIDVQRFGADPLRTLRDNLARVTERIERACARAGRPSDAVRLLPITKTVPASILRHAFDVGLRSFGENKIQEAIVKREALAELPIAWSIVGHLQTNKARHLTRFASEFQALDSLRVAEALQHRLELAGGALDVHIQVNTSGEASKFGLHPDDLPAFVDQLDRFPRLRPRGLMTLAVFSPDTDRVRACFRRLRTLRDQTNARRPAIAELSMGMSGDFETAIEEGADVVRVGQALFGTRPTPDAHYWPGAAGT